MKWRWALVALVVVCALGWVWPYWGAYSLANAAGRHDVEAVTARIDFPQLRHSLARQIVRSYLKQSGRGEKLGAMGRNLAVSIGTTVADPYLADLLAPEHVATLLGEGRLEPVTVEGRTLSFDRRLPQFPSVFGSRIGSVILSSYYDGIGRFLFNVPGPVSDDTFGLHMVLSGATWQLSGIDLPSDLVDRIAADIVAREKENKPS